MRKEIPEASRRRKRGGAEPSPLNRLGSAPTFPPRKTFVSRFYAAHIVFSAGVPRKKEQKKILEKSGLYRERQSADPLTQALFEDNAIQERFLLSFIFTFDAYDHRS